MSVDEALPNITSQPGTVGSRFVSQNDLDQAKARREEQWKAAYARFTSLPFLIYLIISLTHLSQYNIQTGSGTSPTAN